VLSFCDTKLQQKIKNLSAYIAPVDDIPVGAATIKVEQPFCWLLLFLTTI
jgi:hypothetical protein